MHGNVGNGQSPADDPTQRRADMTLIWFVIWLIANVVGDDEPLLFDPVNWWAGTLILAVALDLARQHAVYKKR
jgi:hypothetical protein